MCSRPSPAHFAARRAGKHRRPAAWLAAWLAVGCGEVAVEERATAPYRLDAAALAHDQQRFEALASVGNWRRADLLADPRDPAWENFGYVAAGEGASPPGRIRTVAPEAELAPLVPLGVDTVGAPEAVAIISIDRGPAGDNYIMGTLASVLGALPPRAQVNVLVGDARADYLAGGPLVAALGEDAAARVHVWPPSQEVADHLAHHFTIYQRGSWNYARALRSHRGSGGLLLLEDDVRLSRGAVEALAAVLAAGPPAWTSLYNGDCLSRPRPAARPPVELFRVSSRGRVFVGAQGMFVPADVAAALGRYMQLRLHIDATDGLITWFGHTHDLPVHYTFPSLVQHVGQQTTGLAGRWHESACFAEGVACP